MFNKRNFDFKKTTCIVLVVGLLFVYSILESQVKVQYVSLGFSLADLSKYSPDHKVIWQEPIFSMNTLNTEDKTGYSDSVGNTLSTEETPTKDTPLITLFTTFKIVTSRDLENHNTLKHWAALMPVVRPVLFYSKGDDVEFISTAKTYGWLVYEAPSTRNGIPMLRPMFEFVINNIHPKSYFIGYANSDIIFTQDLNKTLTYISHLRWYRVSGQGLLVIGQRQPTLTQSLVDIATFQIPDMLNNKDRTYDSIYSIDYFITTENGFPFHLLPDFVVGKPAYDTWIVSKAIEWNIRVIDCTHVISALHQVRDFKTTEKGWLSSNVCINYNIVPPFPTGRGKTVCAQYELRRLPNGRERMFKRLAFPHSCANKPRKKIYEQICKAATKKNKANLKKGSSQPIEEHGPYVMYM